MNTIAELITNNTWLISAFVVIVVFRRVKKHFSNGNEFRLSRLYSKLGDHTETIGMFASKQAAEDKKAELLSALPSLSLGIDMIPISTYRGREGNLVYELVVHEKEAAKTATGAESVFFFTLSKYLDDIQKRYSSNGEKTVDIKVYEIGKVVESFTYCEAVTE
ncbi:hypothetical protein [Butyrivibrio sp. MC2013]|uniref:hypothetical protein n=1 Tax=Butyrivibrio sp. MC2013 TaxID=1280686 RepID=UPI000479FCE2|nr:hypothetical protein [Butyrivibrio sp. MC2013]